MGTELTLTKRRKQARELYQELLVKLHQHSYLFLKIGELLKTIRDEKMFKYLGEGGYDTFLQFLAGPEIALKQSTAYMYIHIFEFYKQKLEMTDEEITAIPSYKLLRLMPILKDKSKEEAEKVLEGVVDLGTMDTELTIREKGLDPYDRPRVYQCLVCKKWIVRYSEKSVCQCDGEFHLINEDIAGKG